MSSFKYRDKEYDAEKLVAISSQGVTIKVDIDKLDIVGNLKSSHIFVVANEGRYDVLGGTLFRNRETGIPSPSQTVKLLSKPVLKKALIPEKPAVDVNAPIYADGEYRHSSSQYGHRDERPRQFAPRYEERRPADFGDRRPRFAAPDQNRPQGDNRQRTFPQDARPQKTYSR